MRRIITILTFLLLNLISTAQIDFGIYSYESDYIKISKDSVCFDLTNYGCFITHVRGCGIYNFVDNYLLIETKEYNGLKSTVRELINNTDSINITIVDQKGKPVIGVMVQFIDSSGNFFGGIVTNNDGIAVFEKQSEIDLIRIIYIACDPIDFKFKSEFDYSVNLVEGNVTEYQTVVFEIISANSNRLKLTLLDTDFKAKKDIKKSLRKIKRHNRKHNHSINDLKKQLPTANNTP